MQYTTPYSYSLTNMKMASNFSALQLNSSILSNGSSVQSGIEVVKFKQTFNELSVPASIKHKITINLATDRYVIAKIGDNLHEKRVEYKAVSLIPANQSSQWRHLTYSESNILQLYLQPAFLCKVAVSTNIDLDIELVGQLGVQDSQIKHIALALLAELEAGYPSGQLYSESAATMLAVRLLKHYSAHKPVIGQYKGKISKRILRRVLEYIDDKFAENLSLDELAAIANLSQYHFVRQFKQTTGLTPHQFLLNLRLEKAKSLLQNCTLPIADIALQSGFADQSHFTRVFKKHFGCTPRDFRRFL